MDEQYGNPDAFAEEDILDGKDNLKQLQDKLKKAGLEVTMADKMSELVPTDKDGTDALVRQRLLGYLDEKLRKAYLSAKAVDQSKVKNLNTTKAIDDFVVEESTKALNEAKKFIERLRKKIRSLKAKKGKSDYDREELSTLKKYEQQIIALSDKLEESNNSKTFVEGVALALIVGLGLKRVGKQNPVRINVKKAATDARKLALEAKKAASNRYKIAWFKNRIAKFFYTLFRKKTRLSTVIEQESKSLNNQLSSRIACIDSHREDCAKEIGKHQTYIVQVEEQQSLLSLREVELTRELKGKRLPGFFARLLSSSKRKVYNKIKADKKRLKGSLKHIQALSQELQKIQQEEIAGKAYQKKKRKILVTIRKGLGAKLVKLPNGKEELQTLDEKFSSNKTATRKYSRKEVNRMINLLFSIISTTQKEPQTTSSRTTSVSSKTQTRTTISFGR